MIVEHRAAVKTLLGAVETTLYLGGQVPDEPTFPYLVLFMGTGIDDETKLCRTPDKATFRFQLTSVGLTDDSVAIVADQGRTAVLGIRPVVAGRKTNPIRKETDIPVRADKDVTVPPMNLHPMFGVDTYVFESWKD